MMEIWSFFGWWGEYQPNLPIMVYPVTAKFSRSIRLLDSVTQNLSRKVLSSEFIVCMTVQHHDWNLQNTFWLLMAFEVVFRCPLKLSLYFFKIQNIIFASICRHECSASTNQGAQYMYSEVMKTIQCAHPPHHHNGFVPIYWLWTTSGRVADHWSSKASILSQGHCGDEDGRIVLSSWHDFTMYTTQDTLD